MRLSAARTSLATPRLWLRASEPALVSAVLAFQVRNRSHFQPWDPPIPEDFHTLDVQRERLRRCSEDFELGEGFRWWLSLRDRPQDVVGTINLSSVSRGAFHSARLGYALDEALQGQGLMHEALQAVIAEAFAPRINLHRIQAAWRPENLRSGAVLARAGFDTIGLATHYLFIDGAWRDHCLAQRINPAHRAPTGW